MALVLHQSADNHDNRIWCQSTEAWSGYSEIPPLQFERSITLIGSARPTTRRVVARAIGTFGSSCGEPESERPPVMTHFSKVLSGLAKERGLGYEKLANLVSLSPVFVWRLMVGQKNPSLATIYRLSKALSEVPPIDKGTEGNLFPMLLTAALEDDLARDRLQRKRKDA